MNRIKLDQIIKTALEEDIYGGDLTSEFTISRQSVSKAVIKIKSAGILCGVDVAKRVLEIIDNEITFDIKIHDATEVKAGDIAVELYGNTRNILYGERTALNFLQRMSGIATMTNLFCQEIEGTGAKIVDTRKTTPGLRMLDKYAVICGGGTNHRYCLSDGILIKDNHIKAVGGVKNALRAVKGKTPHTIKIEVEVFDLLQLREVLDEGADIIMLDNMNAEEMKEAVRIVNGRALIEASGGINLDNVRAVASTGVDLISIGALTHSVKAMDISMKIY